jgi:ferredoxin-fold anticodon binding domain-containing protein
MEALFMIAVKIARILQGNHLEPDHYKDIAGYAILGMAKDSQTQGEKKK